MARLCVTNVPEDLAEALKQSARRNGRSIAAEVRHLLAENVVTLREHTARLKFLRKAGPPESPPTLESSVPFKRGTPV
jgi:plasmid stability protein